MRYRIQVGEAGRTTAQIPNHTQAAKQARRVARMFAETFTESNVYIWQEWAAGEWRGFECYRGNPSRRIGMARDQYPEWVE